MLIGAALFKLGILQGQRTRRFYIALTAACYGFGLTARAWGAWEQTRFANDPELNWAYGYQASIATMVGACVALYVGFKRSGWL